MQRYLLDTNAVIYLVNGLLATKLPESRYSISVISEIELLSYANFTGCRRTENTRTFGYNPKYSADAIIAASALSENSVLLTNDQAFLAIDDLNVKPLQLILEAR